MKLTVSPRLKYFWPAALLLTFIFFPIFIARFGAHTDGFYILTKKGDWLGNPEGSIIFMQGRPLLTYLTSFLGWFTHTVDHFTVLRVTAFILKLVTSYFLFVLCCSLSLDYMWAILIAV